MPRKKKSNLLTSSFQWGSAKGLKRAYDLYDGNNIVGHLRWKTHFGSLAEAEYGANRWTYKRGGFLRPHVTVREPASDVDLAILELSWGGSGMLKMRNGTRFRWERVGFWGRKFAFSDETGAELLGIEPKLGFMHRRGTVEIHPGVRKMPELGLLVTLAWYVIMLVTDDEGASSAVVVACCS